MGNFIGTDGPDSINGDDSDDTIDGGGGDDYLQGYGGTDTIFGGSGNDQISGGSGNDRLEGNAGNDRLGGGEGADELVGGAGNDYLFTDIAGGYGDVISGGSGFDTLSFGFAAAPQGARFVGSASGTAYGVTYSSIESFDLFGGDYDDELAGGRFADSIRGGNGADTVNGAGGNDYLDGGTGADRLNGGSGNDLIYVDDGDEVDGGSGFDTIYRYGAGSSALTFAISDGIASLDVEDGASTEFRNVESYQVYGSYGGDDLDGTGASSVIVFADDGDDQVTGSAGADTLYGGYGEDVIRGAGGADYIVDEVLGSANIDAGSGNDDVSLYSRYDDFMGGPSGETDSFVSLGAGNDRLSLRLPEVLITGSVNAIGGTGVDALGLDHWDATGDVVATVNRIDAGAFSVRASGFEVLVVQAGRGADELTGGKYSDVLDGGTGEDVLLGMGGDDDLRIGEGGFADGGRGTDHITVDFGKSSTAIDFTCSSGTVEINSNTTFSNMESFRVIGSKGDDRIVGSDGDDQLSDGTGDDRLYGAGGDDVFTRGPVDTSRTLMEVYEGEDIHENPGIDSIDGGTGFDTLQFAPKNLRIASYHWVSILFEQVELDLTYQSRNSGAAAGLTVTSIERIDSGSLGDRLFGDGRANEFHSGQSSDFINGRGGNDTLVGGSGSDDLWGGSGRDRFVYNDESFNTWKSYPSLEDTSGDRIHDFTRGKDKLVFEDIEATGKVVTVGHGSNGEDASTLFYFDVDSHRLWMAYEGDDSSLQDTQVCVAVLDDVSTLSAADFLFV